MRLIHMLVLHWKDASINPFSRLIAYCDSVPFQLANQLGME
jgi:hypothetical protein